LAYAEWEILTFFAATLGPAEAAAWTMMGFVWDTFESTTEAIGDTSEVRVSYQLGRGRPAMAKLAAYKCMILGLGVSGVISIIVISLSDVLPSLLTTNATLQAMLTELFPIVALGNVTMSMGMVCWTVIGAQGRYHLLTTVAIVISFVVTVPLRAIMTIGLNINLQGLVFAIFMGYTITTMILFALILMSDWEKPLERIQKQVASGEISLSDSSCDELSCSSEDIQSEQISIPPIPAGLFPCNIEIQRQTI
jgi:Na+-driven multidrug efflux pump